MPPTRVFSNHSKGVLFTMKRIALFAALTCLFALWQFPGVARADCANGSCAAAATFTGPVRTLFAHQPVRAVVRTVFGRVRPRSPLQVVHCVTRSEGAGNRGAVRAVTYPQAAPHVLSTI